MLGRLCLTSALTPEVRGALSREPESAVDNVIRTLQQIQLIESICRYSLEFRAASRQAAAADKQYIGKLYNYDNSYLILMLLIIIK